MKKRYMVVPAMALLLGICASCSGNDLPPGFEKEQVIRHSRKFIDTLNQREFQSCYDEFNHVMKNSMSEDKLQNAFIPILEGLGGFVRFKSESLSKSKSLGVEYAVCVLKCIYENGEATFTLSLNQDLQVGGLYIK